MKIDLKPLDAQERFRRRRDYSRYDYTPSEFIRFVLQGISLCAALDYLFYQEAFLMVLSLPVCLFYLKWQRGQLLANRRETFNNQFRDALVSLNVAVQAGYSMENAVHAALRDLRQLYPQGADIVEEFQYIENQLRVSIPLEDLFLDLGKRTGVEDVETFATVFYTAKRTGGNMDEIIQKVTRMLSDKIEVKKEIQASLAAKRFEQTIMSLMPMGIILYLRLASPGFLDVLYGNLLGALAMTVCLTVYAGAWLLGRKLMNIQV